MADMIRRKQSIYPNGIFSFSKLRESGSVYIDKTDLVYALSKEHCTFLSRPRRFGKSLLCSTIQAYFEGKKDLFQGLKIMDLEQEWNAFPVLHFCVSSLKDKPIELMADALGLLLSPYEELYGRNENEVTPGARFSGVIHRAYKKTGKRVVVIVDEYDAPMLAYLNDDVRLAEVRQIMQEFYQTIKDCDAEEQFVFITGITKFSQLSIFSTINNLTNISMDEKYATICGITESELHEFMDADVDILAEKMNVSKQEAYIELKNMYDGYHFCEESEDVYNPFSLMNAFYHKRLRSFWYASGTPSFLINEIKRCNTDVLRYDGAKARETEFDLPTESMNSVLPLMYQAGYLTIKDYNPQSHIYTLGIPNAEVKAGLMENLLPILNGTNEASNASYATQIIDCLSEGNIDKMMEWLQAFLASIPYMQHGKDALKSLERLEALYQRDLYVFFSGMSAQVQVETMMADGRVDMVMHIGDYIFVFEFKVRASASSALEQINTKKYYEPWRPLQRKIVKCGVLFDVTDRTLKDWEYEYVE